MAYFARGLSTAGCDARLFAYPSRTETLAANAARLMEFAAQMPGGVLHFVGHSLGGVVILAMLARHGSDRPGRVVCLGSPLAGSLAADHLARSRPGRWLIGRSMFDLVATHGLPAWRGDRPVGVIAGNVPFGAGRAIAPLARPNDGTVAVEETRLPGTADHIVLPVTHFALLWSSTVIRQTVSFLADGAFRRGEDGPSKH
jgi:pimeloyl-ACP methyl ester carboxylesterase